MFYSHELLVRRRGKYSIIWLLATAGPRCKWNHISNKDIVGVDIPRTCADLIHPGTCISLRLASVLLSGLAQALSRKSLLLHSECNCARSRIVALPWVTSRRSFDPFISSSTTVSSAHLITLPSTNSDLLMEITPGDANSDNARPSGCMNVWRSFGWIGTTDSALPDIAASTGSAHRSCGTLNWSSISLPETQPRIGNSYDMSNERLDDPCPHHDAFSLSADSSSSGGGFLSPGGSGKNDVDALELQLLKREANDELIHFDSDGNLHFISSRASRAQGHTTDEDIHTELFPIDSPGPLAHQIGDAGSDTKPSLLSHGHVPANEAADPDSHTGKPLVVEDTETLWESIENAVIQNIPHAIHGNRSNPFATRLKSNSSRQYHRSYDYCYDDDTFEPQVPGLWGATCVWDADLGSKAATLLIGRLIGRRAAVASKMYTSTDVSLTGRLSVPMYPHASTDGHQGVPGYNEAAVSAADYSGEDLPDSADGYPFYDDIYPDEIGDALELELGRGAADNSIEQQQRLAEEEAVLNLRMDIPWLNSGIVHSTRPRSSISRPPSIRTESSPNIGARHSIEGLVDITSSGSAIPSSDPLIPDDHLDIHQFQLEVGTPADASSRSSVSDMDSFLRDGRVKHSMTRDGGFTESMDPELKSFQTFVMSRMQECGKTSVSFSDILLDPYKTRRVAARAFVDILYMATMSVFRVGQENVSSKISITLL
ncbi:R8 protein [Coemansia sp. RSA 1933]|nr:R8 protein [Coemansia sp. RSA 1933]